VSEQQAQDERPRAARRRRWLAVVALAVVAAIGLGVALVERGGARDRAGGAAAKPPAVPVGAVAAHAGDVHVYLDEIGTVTPLATVTVRTRVDGELMSVHFREGDLVHEGDLLAEIDPRPFQVQLEQAQGQLARDQALLENARVDLKRYRTLVAQDSIPKQQLDTQVSLVHQDEAALATDQAQIDSAKLQLTYARITAPISGRLGLRLVDAGNIVHATDTGGLVVVTQTQPIGVVFPVPEDDLQRILPQLRSGVTLQVEAWDREGKQKLATGHVLTIDNAIDPTTGTVRVKAEFDNADEALFPSQFVNARLLVEVRHDATLVPSAAVQHGTPGPFVYVVSPEKTVEVRDVTLGPSEGDDTQIAKGVAPGELVVVDGTQALRPGAPVTLTDADRQTAVRDSS